METFATLENQLIEKGFKAVTIDSRVSVFKSLKEVAYIIYLGPGLGYATHKYHITDSPPEEKIIPPTGGEWVVNTSTEYEVSVVSPWNDNNPVEKSATFGDYRGSIICSMHYNSGVPTKTQAIANAKIISAAKDLLTGCEMAKYYLSRINCGDEGDQALQAIDKAITKATI